ncbi:LOW QUALITY PROTEIN: mitogen-activated protein kinase 15 [Trichechus inunguis]
MCSAEMDPHVAQRYLPRRRLGKGAYGIVWKAVDRRTGAVVAIKKIFDAFRDKTDAQHSPVQQRFLGFLNGLPDLPHLSLWVPHQHSTLPLPSVGIGVGTRPSAAFQDTASLLLHPTPVFISFQRTFREIMLLQEFGDHPNIIRLLDVMPAENDRDIYLVFEFMDTDLNAVIRKGKLLKDIHKRYIFYQLLRATKFIHSGNVIHRDQKPSNVLLDANCLVKLCDFGLARSLSQLPEGPEGHALTEYVATRWYRAPEVLLSSRWYTPGVDMWSLGCILGEMLRGRPLFPGSSTLHQLQLILESVPLPPEEDFPALGSGYCASVLQRLGTRPQQTLDTLLPPDTPTEALDLLRQLLVFAPDKRLSAAQALRHPYVQRFRCAAHEWTLEADVQLPVPEGVQLSAPEYRSRLYQMILERRGNRRVQGQEGRAGASPGGRPSASGPQEHPLEPRAVQQLPSGTPAQNSGTRPQSSPAHDPAHETPGGAKNIPRQNVAPLFQPLPPGGLGRGRRPPGVAAKSPPAPSWVKPRGRGSVPSLTAQAAAEVANQALIRRERTLGRGVRAAGARQEARPEPRPGRRMFSVSALLGAQGAARASLGGYSQEYGTLCQSALGRLPLPGTPRSRRGVTFLSFAHTLAPAALLVLEH